MKIRRKKSSLVLTLFIAAILGTSAYAFTAGVTFPATGAGSAGDGSDVVSGYVITDGPHYAADAANDANVGTVDFDLDLDANTVQVELSEVGVFTGNLVSCTGGPTAWSCDVSGENVTIEDLDGLRVVALG